MSSNRRGAKNINTGKGKAQENASPDKKDGQGTSPTKGATSGTRAAREEEEKKRAQDELREKVISEQLARDPVIEEVEKLNKKSPADPLSFQGITGEPKEWTNLPPFIAKFLIRNQQQLIAVVKHNKARSLEETT